MSFSRQHAVRSTMAVPAVVVAIVVIGLMLGALGCGKPGLVGTWYNADEDVTLEFTSDGKVVSEDFGGVKPDYKAEKGTITITLGGQVFLSAAYKVDGDTLTVTDNESGETQIFVRQTAGGMGGAVTTASEVTDTSIQGVDTSDELSVDPALVGAWYSAEVGETLEFTADSLVLSTYDGDEGSLELVYSADGSLLVISDGTDTFAAQYSIEGDVLTMIDPETGDPVTYQRVGG